MTDDEGEMGELVEFTDAKGVTYHGNGMASWTAPPGFLDDLLAQDYVEVAEFEVPDELAHLVLNIDGTPLPAPADVIDLDERRGRE